MATSFGKLARFQAAMALVYWAPTLSRPRWTVWAMPPTVLAQAKGSSILFSVPLGQGVAGMALLRNSGQRREWSFAR